MTKFRPRKYVTGNPDVLQALKVTPEQAQNLANDGALVVAAWQNPSGASGHVATVRADFGPYSEDAGPLLGNVGGEMGVWHADRAYGIGNPGRPQSLDDVSFYFIPDRGR
jgi:hypothetical protein